MKIKQLYLDGFSHHLCGSRSGARATALAGSARELGGLSKLAGRFFPGWLLNAAPTRRNRDFPLFVTFWAFFAQVLTRNASCRAVLSSVQAWCASRGKRMPSDDTSAYCQARSRLPLECLRAIFTAIGEWISKRDRGEALFVTIRVLIIESAVIVPERRRKGRLGYVLRAELASGAPREAWCYEPQCRRKKCRVFAGEPSQRMVRL